STEVTLNSPRLSVNFKSCVKLRFLWMACANQDSNKEIRQVIVEKHQIWLLTRQLGTRIVTTASKKKFGMQDLVAYVDGGSLGNPGPSGIGVIIDGCDNGPIRIQKWIGHQDNNVAEYLALLEALQRALEMSARALHVFSDSEIVVKQMRGEYTCRSPRLYSLNWICRKLARSLEFSISHIRRENNSEANSLASSAARGDAVPEMYTPVAP
ncbi:MAG TPA: ribonuclease HI family protein, partial [Terriglobales bacterium]|nr:ribonuclease HI family protein [Terriglobales bacterium]